MCPSESGRDAPASPGSGCQLKACGNFERNGGFQAQRLCGAFDAEARDIGVEPADTSVDAVGERGDDGFDVCAVGGPLGVPVTVRVHAASKRIASHCGWAEDFGELACSDAAPEINLEETVRGGNVYLGENR